MRDPCAHEYEWRHAVRHPGRGLVDLIEQQVVTFAGPSPEIVVSQPHQQTGHRQEIHQPLPTVLAPVGDAGKTIEKDP